MLPEKSKANPPSMYKAATIARFLDVHPSTVWRWAEQGRIPKPIKLSAGVTRWLAADVDTMFAEVEG